MKDADAGRRHSDLLDRARLALQAGDASQARLVAADLRRMGLVGDAEELEEALWARADRQARQAVREKPDRLEMASKALLLALDAAHVAPLEHERMAWELVDEATDVLRHALRRTPTPGAAVSIDLAAGEGTAGLRRALKVVNDIRDDLHSEQPWPGAEYLDGLTDIAGVFEEMIREEERADG